MVDSIGTFSHHIGSWSESRFSADWPYMTDCGSKQRTGRLMHPCPARIFVPRLARSKLLSPYTVAHIPNLRPKDVVLESYAQRM